MPIMTKKLNDYREEHYMNVVDFAAFLGISVNTFYRILHGEKLNYSTMNKVAARLGVHPSEIAEFVRKSSE